MDVSKKELKEQSMGLLNEQIEVIEPEIIEPEPHHLEGKKAWNATDEEKIFEVLTAVMESGGRVTETARQYGIPIPTLEKWLHKHKEEMQVFNEVERHQVSTLMLHRTKELANGITKSKIENAGLRDIAIAMGIAADKWKDLAGPATGSRGINLRFAFKDGSGALELTTGSE